MSGGFPSVAIVGGSVGGLAAGVCLRQIGCDVEIYERSSEELSGRGAGIVVQPQLARLIGDIAGQRLPITSCMTRRQIDAATSRHDDLVMPQQFTSWSAIIGALRKAFPAEHYHAGRALTGFEQKSDLVSLQFGDEVIQADTTIFADGSGSFGRRRFEPDSTPAYAGYIAWRGTVAEADLPDELQAFFHNRFTFTAARNGGHALCYFIPGDDAATQVGKRRLNWVWYETVAEGADLDELLLDRNGQQRRRSISAGMMGEMPKAYLRANAERELDPWFRQLIELTTDPFVQAIEDLAVDRMAYDQVCLLGDAAFVVRPHTAGATAKASGDAMTLADAIKRQPDDIPGALRNYEAARLPAGRSMSHLGLSLGKQSVRTR